jgi:O-antigen/teichoic acid export membrane protein
MPDRGDPMRVIRQKWLLLRTGRGMFGASLQTMATRTTIFALNIGTGIITARVLGAEGRGLLASLLTWPQFVAYSMTFGLFASFVFNVKASPSEKGVLFAAGNLYAGALGVAAAVVGAVLMPILLPGFSAQDLRVAQGLMLAAPLILLSLMLQTAAEAAGDFSGANTLRGVSVLGTFAAVCALALAGALSPVAAAVCYLAPQLPVAVWLCGRLRRDYKPTLSGFRQVSRRLIVYGLRCYPIELLTAASAYVGQAIVVLMLDPASVGYFTLSVGLARLLEIFFATAASVLLPSIAARRPSEVVEKTVRAARLTFLIMVLFAVPALLLIPVVLPLVYGADFAGAANIARLLVMEGVISGTVWVLLQAFVALGRPELPTMVHGVTVLLSAVLLLVFIPPYGVLGAAASLLAVSVVKLIFAMGLYRSVLAVPLRRMLHDRSDLLFLHELLQR